MLSRSFCYTWIPHGVAYPYRWLLAWYDTYSDNRIIVIAESCVVVVWTWPLFHVPSDPENRFACMHYKSEKFQSSSLWVDEVSFTESGNNPLHLCAEPLHIPEVSYHLNIWVISLVCLENQSRRRCLMSRLLIDWGFQTRKNVEQYVNMSSIECSYVGTLYTTMALQYARVTYTSRPSCFWFNSQDNVSIPVETRNEH